LQELLLDPFRSKPSSSANSAEPLFLFGAGRVVLLGYRDGDEWVLARGWRTRDRFSDIRRWRFPGAEHFTAQVFRLIREEAPHDASARRAEEAAAAWAVGVFS
jgi:hypothetical protein